MLNVHFHSLLLDGVYVCDMHGSMRFLRLPAPDDTEIERVTRHIVRRLRRLLIRRGLTPDTDPTDADPLRAREPLLANIYAASIRSRSAMAERAGRRLLRIGERIDAEEAAFVSGPRCTSIDGVSLHANVSVPTRDRRRLEKLCRYVARPPVSTQRLSRLEDGRLLYRLKRRWRDGTTHVVFEPLELVEKLAAIIPPPRCHVIRYHGVFAPRACRRAEIVAQARPRTKTRRSPAPHAPQTSATRSHPTPHRERHSLAEGEAAGRKAHPVSSSAPRSGRHWIPWAELMRRVFDLDVLQCAKCGGPMLMLDVVLPPEATRELLESLQLPTRAPPLAPSAFHAPAEA